MVGSMPLYQANPSEIRKSLVVHGAITLALGKVIHVALANRDFSAVLLQAWKQALVEGHAWVLLLQLLLLLLFRLGVTLRLLLRSSLVLVTTVAATTAHHGADGLVTDFGAGSESHTGSNGAHETTTAAEHATGLLLGSSRVGSGWSLGGSGWCSRWPAGAAREKAASAATSWSWTWTSSA